MSLDLYPHQIKAVRELGNGKVLKGGVGTGKSIVALVYYFVKLCHGSLKLNGQGEYKEMSNPLDLYIITTAKKRDQFDWDKEAAFLSLSRDPESCHPGVKFVVDSWNNVTNYTEVKNAFFIFDEQRLVGRGAWVKAFLKIAQKNQWVVLSATPGDSWMDYAPIFVANGFYRNRTEFLRRHVVYNNFTKFPKVDHYVETGHLNSLRARITVEMPYLRHTKRHLISIPVVYDLDEFSRVHKDRWNVDENRPIKDISEYCIMMRRVVNRDPSRKDAIKMLLDKHPRLIIFYNFDYELELLRELTSEIGIPTAEWNGHKHQELPTTERWAYLVQYLAGAEGWNCTSTDAVAFWSLTYSYKVFEQAQGRIDRLNTKYTDLYYYLLKSNSVMDRAITRSLASKKDFNERLFTISWPKTQN